PTPEGVLQHLEALEPVLRGLVDAKHIKGALSVSPSLVSLQRQRADRALLARTVYADGAALSRVMNQLGFDAGTITARQSEFAQSEGQFLTPCHWLTSPLSAPVRHL